jgi:hypothetical protein
MIVFTMTAIAEYVRIVDGAPLGFGDRILCYAVTARWVVRDRCRYVKDLLIAADQLARQLCWHFAISQQCNGEVPYEGEILAGGVGFRVADKMGQQFC